MAEPVIVDYRPEWPAAFATTARTIETLLGNLLAGPVEHIGSTAIPGMIGKPLIDMMAPVDDLAVARQAAEQMATLGYSPRPHRVDAVLVVRRDTIDTYTHGLHLTRRDSDLWEERLLFRDTLRASEPLRARYAELKRAMVAAPTPYDSRDKRAFVREVLRDAGLVLRDDRHDPTR